jgi:16S rRNA (uracil1498-N3)-methyltransferase
MNIIILEDHQLRPGNTAQLSGRYFEHITKVLKSKVGDTLNIGRLNGLMGQAQINSIGSSSVELTIPPLTTPPPPTLPISIILGLPRPRMLQRTLQTIATMGVEHLYLIQTSRVEKSFWQTPLLKPSALHEQLILGLEQGKATQLPSITCHQQFRPFLEDHLLSNSQDARKLIAHPGNYAPAQRSQEPTMLAIGPEGGFSDEEIEAFSELDFTPIQLGERILRVETAIPVLLAKLF